jgi:methylated-DNA-[protein]-cysteine S-methyltransferase
MPFDIVWVDRCSGVEDIGKMATPAGTLMIYSRSGVITGADWDLTEKPELGQSFGSQAHIGQYWDNPAQTLEIHLLRQGTPFQNRVWAELARIPFGATVTYSALAKKIGSAARAIGNACRNNPFPVLIPCHRVVAVSGMGGYSGQTQGDMMKIKINLLQYEAAFKS